jgi:aspartate aminotransferase
MIISKRVTEYMKQGSWIRRLFEEGALMNSDGSGKPVYDFSIGNPDLEPPKEFETLLKNAVADSASGTHKYMANTGYVETRQAVADGLNDDYKLGFTADNIVMTGGAGGAINVTLKALIDDGEEVIAIAPYFVEYDFYVQNHGGVLKVVDADPNFNLDVLAIEEAISVKTRVVIITNPNNPTGVLYPQETLNSLGEMLTKKSKEFGKPIFLIDDAPYRKLVYDAEKCTSAFDAYSYTIMGTSHSKDLGLPGERIGFLAVSPKIEGWKTVIDACAFTNRTLGFVNAPALMQRVVRGLQKVTIDLDWYRTKRDILYNSLTEMGYEIPYPDGAFYMFPKAPIDDDLEFIEILKRKRVLVVPGTGFGKSGYFRISYCVSEDKIRGALTAFKEAIDEVKNK